MPIVLIVTVEVVPDRIEDFLKAMEIDAIGSRTNENGGCLRFDVNRDATDPNKFYFYEVYVDADAIERHKLTPHFKAWTDFRESGGVVSFSVIKGSTVFFQG